MKPLDALLARVDWCCAKCGVPRRIGCECFTTCSCGRVFEVGGECPNPRHRIEASAQELAADAVKVALRDIASHHPVQMKTASGGFRRTLRVAAERTLMLALTEWSMADKPEGLPEPDMLSAIESATWHYQSVGRDADFCRVLLERLDREAAEIVTLWVDEARKAEVA